MDEQIDTTTAFTSELLVIRPGDVLFVMPAVGEFWVVEGMKRIAAIVKEQLPEAIVIVLPNAATFTTVAVEDRAEAVKWAGEASKDG